MTIIPITEGASESAGRLVVEVSVDAQGRARVRGTTDEPTFARRVEDAMATPAGLDKIRFYTPTGSLVRGWEGFWGTALALRLTLPAVGLAVDWGRLDGPWGTDVTDEFLGADAPDDPETVEWLDEGDDNATTV